MRRRDQHGQGAVQGRARCVAGGGATEIELAHQIQTFGKASSGLDQYAIGKFGEALECVPRVLAENSGRDAIKVLSALYDAHKKGEKGAGVHVDDGSVVDQAAAGVHDSLFVKESAINLAADAAITVLRVDLIIMAKAAGGPEGAAAGRTRRMRGPGGEAWRAGRACRLPPRMLRAGLPTSHAGAKARVGCRSHVREIDDPGELHDLSQVANGHDDCEHDGHDG